MYKKRMELDDEPHPDTGKLRLKMLADQIQRHKAETDLELFNPTQQMKEDEIVKKGIMFIEQLQRKEEHIKARSTMKDYLAKATEGAVYRHHREPLPQHMYTAPANQAQSSTPAMDIVREDMARKRKTKDANSGNER